MIFILGKSVLSSCTNHQIRRHLSVSSKWFQQQQQKQKDLISKQETAFEKCTYKALLVYFCDNKKHNNDNTDQQKQLV